MFIKVRIIPSRSHLPTQLSSRDAAQSRAPAVLRQCMYCAVRYCTAQCCPARYTIRTSMLTLVGTVRCCTCTVTVAAAVCTLQRSATLCTADAGLRSSSPRTGPPRRCIGRTLATHKRHKRGAWRAPRPSFPPITLLLVASFEPEPERASRPASLRCRVALPSRRSPSEATETETTRKPNSW